MAPPDVLTNCNILSSIVFAYGFNTSVVAELKRSRLACPISGDDVVHPNRSRRPHSSSNFLQRVFYPAFDCAGLKRAELIASRLRFHQPRRTFATPGISIQEVSRYLGHSNIAVTPSVYTHVLPGGHDTARSKLTDLHEGGVPRGKVKQC